MELRSVPQPQCFFFTVMYNKGGRCLGESYINPTKTIFKQASENTVRYHDVPVHPIVHTPVDKRRVVLSWGEVTVLSNHDTALMLPEVYLSLRRVWPSLVSRPRREAKLLLLSVPVQGSPLWSLVPFWLSVPSGRGRITKTVQTPPPVN